MADYRLYYLDRDGHITGAVGFISANDDVAIKAAIEAADGQRMELWQLKRRVFAQEARADTGYSATALDPTIRPSAS
jgi:hypothetical protein